MLTFGQIQSDYTIYKYFHRPFEFSSSSMCLFFFNLGLFWLQCNNMKQFPSAEKNANVDKCFRKILVMEDDTATLFMRNVKKICSCAFQH